MAASTGIGHRMFNALLDVIPFFHILKAILIQIYKGKMIFYEKIIFGTPPLTCQNVKFGRDLIILLVTEVYF